MHSLKAIKFVPDDLFIPSGQRDELLKYNLCARDIEVLLEVDLSQTYQMIEVFGSENDLVRFLVDVNEPIYLNSMYDFDPVYIPEQALAAG